MSDRFIGEIRLFTTGFAPRDWMDCMGQLLTIAHYPALYSILGTAFGGDGEINFAIPNFTGRAPRGAEDENPAQHYKCGEQVGASQVALAHTNLPSHTHTLSGDDRTPESPFPEPNRKVGSFTGAGHAYSDVAPSINEWQTENMHDDMLAFAGSGTAHENRQPYLVMRFCIAVEGLYPPRS